MNTINTIEFGADWWRRIRGPTEHARGLPNEVYVSGEVFELEKHRLFGRTWCFAGRASAIANRGDVIPVEVAGVPLFLVRDSNDQIRAFHNVCPHRGARLIAGPTRTNRNLVCPYHAWTYQLDGRLKNRPHFAGHGCHDDGSSESADPVTLFRVRTHRWHDWVFVDLSDEAPDFEAHMAPALECLTHFPLDAFVYERTIRSEFKANWKLVAENFLDVYHVFKVHPDLDRIYRGPRTSAHTNGAVMYNEYFATSDDRGGDLPPPDGLPDTWEGRCFFSNIYPNLGLAAYPSNVYLVEFIPVSAAHTVMEMHFYFVDGDETPAIAEGRKQLLKWWTDLNAEDEGVCELLQLGRQSPAYPGGRLSPHWDRGTQHFARLIAEALSSEPPATKSSV